MTEQEMLDRIKELEEENKSLKDLLNRGNSGHTSAYNSIRAMIIAKVEKEIDFSQIEEWNVKFKRQKCERQIMRDLLWEIRVRRVSDLREEHIKKAEEYIKNYNF